MNMRLKPDAKHALGRGSEEMHARLEITIKREQLFAAFHTQSLRQAQDDVVERIRAKSKRDECDDDEGDDRDEHQRMIVHAGQDACVVQEDERHAAYKEENGHEGSHDDEHRRLARRYACMTQEHELRHSTARCPRRQEREKVVAEDHLHRLSQRDVLARDLHEVHEARAVKRQTKAHTEERKGDGPRLERREIFQRMNVDRRIDDSARDEENE